MIRHYACMYLCMYLCMYIYASMYICMYIELDGGHARNWRLNLLKQRQNLIRISTWYETWARFSIYDTIPATTVVDGATVVTVKRRMTQASEKTSSEFERMQILCCSYPDHCANTVDAIATVASHEEGNSNMHLWLQH